jgi:hypothetical protein
LKTCPAKPPAVLGLVITGGELGASALAGFAVLLLALPLQLRIAGWVGEIRRRTVLVTDERAKLMAEVLAGVRLIKFFGWERAFADRIAEIHHMRAVLSS